ncbi:MAG TPA: DUF362 domain-containing protein [Prolixibacteraceae bacterium]|nr:DUF362 domain-containing protein [Prolixibacteraceae bacterium]
MRRFFLNESTENGKRKPDGRRNWIAWLFFLFTGLGSTIWFLIRVIPKPSRATYPCMKAAAPFMSGFVVYLLTITGSAFAFRKFRKALTQSRYLAASVFLLVAFIMILGANSSQTREVKAINLLSSNAFTANDPIGEATGLKPGRVVWVWNKHATDENFTPSNNKNNWWANYTNGEEVEKMLLTALLSYTGKNDPKEAWNELFRYFNVQKGKGNVGYRSGEKIYIKLNITNSSSGLDKTSNFNRMDSTPELALALLKHLIEVVGVTPSDIYMGDPFRNFHNLYWDRCATVYPDVHYCCGRVLTGRHQTVPTADPVMHFSDGRHAWRIPQEYADAEYLINMPCLKTHNEGGITLGAKNHQGSVLQSGARADEQYAIDMHYSLPYNNPGYGKYRHLVDYLGHKDLGGKTLITIIDGIWAGRSWEGFVEKWNMYPFNGDYPSSLFISQDRVAVDAVCYDFLLEEYKNKPSNQKYPYFEGCDDYLYQAADPAYWPEGLTYDPEGDGTPLTSMGVYEHWNNPTEMKYSRNLGTGSGIELMKVNLNNDPFTPENSGLVSPKVKKIVVDANGIKWFGTEKGLSRFDGINWTTVDASNHLRENTVNDIKYNASGSELLVATNGGLSVLKTDANGVVSSKTYYVGGAASEILSDTVTAVGIDTKNTRWIATLKGLNTWNGTSWNATNTYMDANREIKQWNELRVNDIESYDNDGSVYIGTSGQGILRYTYNEVDGFTGASAMSSLWSGIWSDTVHAVTLIDTVQWYGTNLGVFQHFGPSTKNYWDFQFSIYDGIYDPVVKDVEVDPDGNVWLGTPSGIQVLTPEGFYTYVSGVQTSAIKVYPKAEGAIITWTNGNGFSGTLFSEKVNDLQTDTDGSMLVASDNGVEVFKNLPGILGPLEPKRAVFIIKSDKGTASPVNRTSYAADPVYPNGSKCGQWACVYNGTGSSVEVFGLKANTTYRVMAFEYLGEPGEEMYNPSEGVDNPVNFTTNLTASNELKADGYRIYPVPFDRSLTIECAGTEHQAVSATLYSSNGIRILSREFSATKATIDTHGLTPGAYILKITGKNGEHTFRILK